MRKNREIKPITAKTQPVSFAEISTTHALLGESPAWDPADNAIWWIDIDGKKLLRTRLIDGTTTIWNTPECPGFVVLAGANQPVLGMETGLFLFDPQQEKFTRVLTLDVQNHRFNDASVDAKGRLWASTMALNADEGQGKIHRVTPALELICVAEGLTTPNGIGVDPALGRLYYSDSHPRSQMIWSAGLDLQTGAVGSPVTFACLKEMSGRPDGAAIDANGNYWIAGVDGAVIYAFSPQGEVLRTLPTPNSYPTKPIFFGPRGDKMALTSKGGDSSGGNLHMAELSAMNVQGPTQEYWRTREA